MQKDAESVATKAIKERLSISLICGLIPADMEIDSYINTDMDIIFRRNFINGDTVPNSIQRDHNWIPGIITYTAPITRLNHMPTFSKICFQSDHTLRDIYFA